MSLLLLFNQPSGSSGNLTQAAGTGVAGTIRGADQSTLAGVAGIGVAGSFVPQVAVTVPGVAGTGVAGQVVGQVPGVTNVNVPAVAGIGVAGSVGGSVSITISGVAGIGVAGGVTITGGANINVPGVAGVGIVGNITTTGGVQTAIGGGNGGKGTATTTTTKQNKKKRQPVELLPMRRKGTEPKFKVEPKKTVVQALPAPVEAPDKLAETRALAKSVADEAALPTNVKAPEPTIAAPPPVPQEPVDGSDPHEADAMRLIDEHIKQEDVIRKRALDMIEDLLASMQNEIA